MKKCLFLVPALFLLCSCASSDKDSKNPFDALTLQRHLEKGKTTQKEILTTFGSPNQVVQNDSGEELWVYNRHSTNTSGATSGAGIGAYIGIPFLASMDGSVDESQSSSRGVDVVMNFDSQKVLSSYEIKKYSY